MTTAPAPSLLEVEPNVFRIPLTTLLEYCDPTLDDPWSCGRISREDVLDVAEFLDRSQPKPAEYDPELYDSYEYNIERIAQFYRYGWESTSKDYSPITVDIGLAGYTPNYIIVDGNHRVAAAKFRGDQWIEVEIVGELPKAVAIFLQGVHPDDYDSGLEYLSR